MSARCERLKGRGGYRRHAVVKHAVLVSDIPRDDRSTTSTTLAMSLSLLRHQPSPNSIAIGNAILQAFPDPDMVGQFEYLAIYDTLATHLYRFDTREEALSYLSGCCSVFVDFARDIQQLLDTLLAEASASALEEQVASELRDMDADGQYVLRL